MPSLLLAETVRRFPELGGGAVLERIPKGGSDRAYYRVSTAQGPAGIVLMTYTDARPDNLKFVPATRILEHTGTPVPKILAEDSEQKFVWLEDIGADDLWSFRQLPWERRRPLYFAALDAVQTIHRVREADVTNEYAGLLEPPFDEKLYRWEQEYFFEHFVGRCTDLRPAESDQLAGGDPFSQLARDLADLPRSLVHRDFQSENVLVRDGHVFLIDYQGLRFGLPEYDVASLVYDPYVPLERTEREELLTHYGSIMPDDRRPQFRNRLSRCAAQRLMQALGAYGNLGLNLGKPHYLDHIPTALKNLAESTENLTELSSLQNLAARLRIPKP